jgi:hypothetical protein
MIFMLDIITICAIVIAIEPGKRLYLVAKNLWARRQAHKRSLQK